MDITLTGTSAWGIEPNNPVDKHAVAVSIFYFLRADPYGKFDITVTGKAVKLGDGDGMQVPCILRLSGKKFMVEILKQQTSIK